MTAAIILAFKMWLTLMVLGFTGIGVAVLIYRTKNKSK